MVATRGNAYRGRSMIQLAENPGMDERDEFGGPGADESAGQNDFDDLDVQDPDDNMGIGEAAFKGRRVSGPRTKLNNSLEVRQSRLEKGLADIASAVSFLAKAQKAQLSKHDDMGDMGNDTGMGGYDEEEDPMDLPPENEDDQNRLDLRMARKARLRKDDSTGGSFGEKDSNVPGNRQFDETDMGEDDTVIQGGPGAGLGPVSKSSGKLSLDARIAKAVSRGIAGYESRLNKGVITGAVGMVADTPGIGSGSSQLDKSVLSDVEMSRKMRGKSFAEINRFRVEIGDLSSGPI